METGCISSHATEAKKQLTSSEVDSSGKALNSPNTASSSIGDHGFLGKAKISLGLDYTTHDSPKLEDTFHSEGDQTKHVVVYAVVTKDSSFSQTKHDVVDAVVTKDSSFSQTKHVVVDAVVTKGSSFSQTKHDVVDAVVTKGSSFRQTKHDVVDAVVTKDSSFSQTKHDVVDAVVTKGSSFSQTKHDVVDAVVAKDSSFSQTKHDVVDAVVAKDSSFSQTKHDVVDAVVAKDSSFSQTKHVVVDAVVAKGSSFSQTKHVVVDAVVVKGSSFSQMTEAETTALPYSEEGSPLSSSPTLAGVTVDISSSSGKSNSKGSINIGINCKPPPSSEGHTSNRTKSQNLVHCSIHIGNNMKPPPSLEGHNSTKSSSINTYENSKPPPSSDGHTSTKSHNSVRRSIDICKNSQPPSLYGLITRQRLEAIRLKLDWLAGVAGGLVVAVWDPDQGEGLLPHVLRREVTFLTRLLAVARQEEASSQVAGQTTCLWEGRRGGGGGNGIFSVIQCSVSVRFLLLFTKKSDKTKFHISLISV